MMHEQYLTFRDLAAKLGLGKSSIYRRIEDGTLPKPIKIGNLSRFKESEVNEALQRLEAQRSA
ncbi:helix-turn-helix transcriptional regulator [Aliiroseovarius sp. YM-037]|uniref:helix-turn-helix transcriptional regulator n=1 Tax=Aliiroseovarius sp. YM-037 TaxID=3341728 RepID=UPI003A7F9018